MAKSKKQPKPHACHCNQCGYDWASKKKHPKHCAACISDKWDKALIGKRLRKAVPSRLGRGGVKGKVAGKRAAKAGAVSGKGTVERVKKAKAPRAPRAPRVKKEKVAPPVEQTTNE